MKVERTALRSFICIGLSFILALSSCSKYAKKVTDTYVGTLSKNDSTISTTDQVLIEAIDHTTISVNHSAFQSYSVEIDKKRYFSSKIYYSTDQDEHLEIFDDDLIVLMHTDEMGNEYFFTGARD